MLLADGYNLQSSLSLKETTSAAERAADKIVNFGLSTALL